MSIALLRQFFILLLTLSHASAIYSGQTFETNTYDAAGRRIIRAISGTGGLDCTYHFYLSGNSVVEENSGSGQQIKTHVWGLIYIDEPAQRASNTDLTSPAWSYYWPMQDANFNVLGLVDSSGTLTERYEYTAYGQRQVFFSAGSNDPGCYAPAALSTRVIASSVTQPYGLCDFGHQGLMHDEGAGLGYERTRYVNFALGRHQTTEPSGSEYVDGQNLYGAYHTNPVTGRDPFGLYNLDSNALFTALFGSKIHQLIWATYDANHAWDYLVERRIWNNNAIKTIVGSVGGALQSSYRPDIVHLMGPRTQSPTTCGVFNIYEIKPKAGAFSKYDTFTGRPDPDGQYWGSGVRLAQAQARLYGKEFAKAGAKWALGPKGAWGTSGSIDLGIAKVKWESPADGAIVYDVEIKEKDRNRVINRLKEIIPRGLEFRSNGGFGSAFDQFEGNVRSEVAPFVIGATLVASPLAGMLDSAGASVGGGAAVEAGALDSVVMQEEAVELDEELEPALSH